MASHGKYRVWQISAGPKSRSYADLLLKAGVALIGPGDAGPWNPQKTDDHFEGSYVRRFANEVQAGDIFLLRTSMSRICAIGLVASDYLYLEQFDDVNGWDLQHCRRVRWFRLPREHDFGSAVFGANPPRISRVSNIQVIEFAERFVDSPPTHWQTAVLPSLPIEEPDIEEVPRYLISLVAQINDLVKLYLNQNDFGNYPSEDEMIVHYIAPFLYALGWPPELVAIKWRYIDIAVFRKLPRIPENCAYILEAKRLGAGVEGALNQAKTYVQAIGVPLDVIVTDGVRYRMYSGTADYAPIGYANLARLKQSSLQMFQKIRRL